MGLSQGPDSTLYPDQKAGRQMSQEKCLSSSNLKGIVKEPQKSTTVDARDCSEDWPRLGLPCRTPGIAERDCCSCQAQHVLKMDGKVGIVDFQVFLVMGGPVARVLDFQGLSQVLTG